MRDYIEIGKVINTHGVAGMVKVEPWCDSPKVLASLATVYLKKGDAFEPRRVLRGSVQGRFVLLHPEGSDSLESAIRLRDSVLYAHRDDIPLADGAVLIDDLKGLAVIDADTGRVYGTLHDVINLGASDLYEVETEKGMVLMPAVKEFLIRVDTENGIFVRPIPGLFDDDMEEA